MGSAKPDSLGAFQKVGLLTTRWATYTMQVPLYGPDPVVAVGLFNLDGVQYTQQMAVDNLSVQFLDD